MRRMMKCPVALVLSLILPATALAQPPWQLVEDLRIGGDDEMTIFTDIRSIVAGPQGHIFVLDARPQEIRVFDRSGKFVTLAARKGQGPGEIARANGILLDRETIWANDPGNGRWSAYSATDGKYLRQITIPINSFGYRWEAGVDAEGRVVDPIFVPSDRIDPVTKRPTSDPRLRRVRPDGTVADTIAAAMCTQRNVPAKTAFTGSTAGRGNRFMGIPFLARPVAVIDGRGGYWCSPNDEYLLVHRALGKTDTLHAVRMPYARLPVGREEHDKAVEEAKKALAEYQVVDADYSLIPKLHPVFSRLDRDDKGQLWARRTTPAGSPSLFDVYDSSGRRVAAVTTAIPFTASFPNHIRGDYVYGVVVDDDEVPYVVRARIVRGGR